MLALAAAAWTGLRSDDRVGAATFLRDGAAADGREVVLSLFDVIAVEGADRYVVGKGMRSWTVAGPSEGLSTGECLSIGGAWRAADGVVVERWREPHPGRGAKKRLGFAAILFLLCALPAWFRLWPRLEVRGG